MPTVALAPSRLPRHHRRGRIEADLAVPTPNTRGGVFHAGSAVDPAHYPVAMKQVRETLLPLLEEQYFGQMSREKVREKFGLAAVRRKAAGDVGLASLAVGPESDDKATD